MIGNMPAEAIRAMQAEYNRNCIHAVTISPFISRDQYGDLTYGAPATHPALVVFRQQSVVNAAGEQQGARGSAALAFNADGTAPAIGDDDRITLPDGTAPVIVAVERDPGDPAISPTIIYF